MIVLLLLKSFKFKAMKLSIWLFASLFLFVSCNDTKVEEHESPYEIFGENFNSDGELMKPLELSRVLDEMDDNDTLDVVFTTTIDAVCQKKGCWMDVEIGNDETVRVTFLDYGFFVPLNASGSEAIIKGKAFWKSETAAEKRHYAEDAGVAYEEHEDVEEEYSPHIIATGVLIKK